MEHISTPFSLTPKNISILDQAWLDSAKLKNPSTRPRHQQLFTPARRERAERSGKGFCCQRPDPFALFGRNIPGEISSLARLSSAYAITVFQFSLFVVGLSVLREVCTFTTRGIFLTGYAHGKKCDRPTLRTDIFVFPSTPTIRQRHSEAQACGVPVIFSDSVAQGHW